MKLKNNLKFLWCGFKAFMKEVLPTVITAVKKAKAAYKECKANCLCNK